MAGKILAFKTSEVKRIIDHIAKSPSHSAPLVGYAKEGPVYGIAEPAVMLVHDQGVYLMSNGEPRDIISGKRSYVAYAAGCNPKDADCWETSRAIVGDDDFCEYLPFVAAIKQKIDAGDTEKQMKLT